MKVQPPFAIDLGTTRTACAIYLPGAPEPQIIQTAHGESSIPSVVTPLKNQPWKVGLEALREPKLRPVESVKRRMGRSEPEQAEIPDSRPQELSAAILQAAHEHLNQYLQAAYPSVPMEPLEAVITIPAYFDAPQIEATRQAAQIAGLRLSALIQEPTAAAIYHCWKNDLRDGAYLVYDLGGGTFDVSIIRALFGDYQILSIDGDNHLGGDDFDRRLAGLIRKKLIQRGGSLRESIETEEDVQAFAMLTKIARQVKEELSFSSSVILQREAGFADLSGEPVELDFVIHRREFEEVIADLLESTLMACRRALAKIAPEGDEIHRFFLVGGSTLIPAVKQRLLAEFGAPLNLTSEDILHDEPTESVALGAALCAAAISPLRFATSEFSLLIDELPERADPYLAGRVELFGETERPDSIHFKAPSKELSLELTPRGDTLSFAAQYFPEDIETFELHRANSLVQGPFEIWLPPGPAGARQAPRLALTNPAVLSKDISLEIVDQDRSANITILPRGTHLPTTTTAELAIADTSNMLVLQLSQGYLPIKTIVLPLPEGTRRGTPVELTLSVDQTMRFQASGTCAGQTFQAEIDRPNPPAHLDWGEIEATLIRADELEQNLWGSEQRRFQEEVENLRAGIRSATYQDPERLQILGHRLRIILDEFSPRQGRSPGIKRIQSLLDRIRQIVFAADDERLGRSRDQWHRELQGLNKEAQEAWDSDDDHRWRSIADRAQALFETVIQDEYFYRRRDPNQHAQALLDLNINRIERLKQLLSDFPLASDGARQALQRHELNQIQRDLAQLQEQYRSLMKAPIIPSLEQWARAIARQEERLQKVHLLGLPQRGGSS